MNLLTEIRDIFFETSEKISFQDVHLYSKKEHYFSELEEVYFDDIFIGMEYSAIKSSLYLYKYQSRMGFARDFCDIFLEMLSQFIRIYPNILSEKSACIPVPMHWSRYCIRGFDHMSKIVKRVSKKSKIPHISPLKAQYSFRQAHLGKGGRKQNRASKYLLKKKCQLPNVVFLFDDVVSTGYTVNACAKLLKNAGVKEVFVFIVASNQSLK